MGILFLVGVFVCSPWLVVVWIYLCVSYIMLHSIWKIGSLCLVGLLFLSVG